MSNFSHGHLYGASLHYPMSIRVIDPVCPRVILPMSVTLFPFGMQCVINIPSMNCNYTLRCSELNGKHAGESFMSPRFRAFEIHARFLMQISEKLTFDRS